MHQINCFGCDVDTKHSENHYFVRTVHSDCYLIMFFKTPFIYKKEEKILEGEKFSYLINPPFAVAEHGSFKEGFANDWIFVKGDMADEIIRQFNLPLNTPFYIDDYSVLMPYIKKISTELVLKHTAFESKVTSIATDMLVNLGRQYELSQKTVHPAFAAINSARNYMLSHIDEKITIKGLAEMSNYSESRFCILYKRFYKSSPIEDLLSARIEKAVTLLGYSHMSVTETAALCGFSSVHYFSRKFKERMGVSPVTYVER